MLPRNRLALERLKEDLTMCFTHLTLLAKLVQPSSCVHSIGGRSVLLWRRQEWWSVRESIGNSVRPLHRILAKSMSMFNDSWNNEVGQAVKNSMEKGVFDGQVAIISGGLGDIGRAVGRELAALGADISVGDILDVEHASTYLAEIAGLDRRVQYAKVDISDAVAVEQWIANVEETLGSPTLIICNAAIVLIGGALTISVDNWARILHVNLDGAFFLARAAAARLIERQMSGRIVFLGSWAAHAAHPQIIAYSVAKAGLRMLCKCMALELAKHDILVNEVAPGYVDGGLARLWYSEHPASRVKNTTLVPLRRLINPDEVAIEVSHLCDPTNRHMTGSTILLDGGLSLVAPGNFE